jgi:hypothetical protein
MLRRYSPASLELTGKNEVVVFALTFLSSTWYIKNPFLKSKLIDVRACSVRFFLGVDENLCRSYGLACIKAGTATAVRWRRSCMNISSRRST